MTSSQLIGRETMIGRLQAFHAARINRVFNAEQAAEKVQGFSYAAYCAKSTRIICKEYDETFSVPEERNGKLLWPWEVRELNA